MSRSLGFDDSYALAMKESQAEHLPILTGIRLNDLGLILEGTLPAALPAIAVQAVFDGLELLLVPKGFRL
jgi:hypothetical protein